MGHNAAMRGVTLGAAGLVAIAGATVPLRPAAEAQAVPTTQAAQEAARARNRATALDQQARAATLASERATVAAAALAARVQQAEAALAAADARSTQVREQRRVLDRALATERAPVTRLLAGLQTQLRRPAVLALLQPGSIQDAVHLRAVVAAVGPQIAARTTALRSSLARARALEAEATRVASLRRQAQSELFARRTELATLSAAERLKASRAAGAANREAERAFAIAAQTRDLSTLVRRLKTSGPERPELGSAAGKSYRLPVAGQLVAAQGANDRSIALLTRPGALVVAPAAGRVAFAGPYRGYGQIVIIEHPDGRASLVTGLAKIQVAVGQQLVSGSPLGQAPGGSPIIGLELRQNGQRLNPLDQIR